MLGKAIIQKNLILYFHISNPLSMALQVNEQAPDFTLPSTSGTDFSLYKDLEGKPCVLYFYPRDFTRGCTSEACDFRDNITFFKGFDIDVLGISRDSIETHQKFREHYKLPFHLLADKSGQVCKAYKALVPLIGIPKRITYLLDKDKKIVAVFEKFFGAEEHIQSMIAAVKQLQVS
jgi:peroxiredoxin Q/BCP